MYDAAFCSNSACVGHMFLVSNLVLKKRRRKIKISVNYGILATAISLPLIIYVDANMARFLSRSQDLTELFSEFPAGVGDIFPQQEGVVM